MTFLDQREQEELLARMNESYERQLSNPVAQEGERVERKLWETTLRDGLDEL